MPAYSRDAHLRQSIEQVPLAAEPDYAVVHRKLNAYLVSGGRTLLTDRIWLFHGHDEARSKFAAATVGRLMRVAIDASPLELPSLVIYNGEMTVVRPSQADRKHPYLALAAPVDELAVLSDSGRDAVTLHVVQQTNAQLQAVESPLRLPLHPLPPTPSVQITPLIAQSLYS